MLLTARFLNDCADVNSWRPADQAQWTAGDAVSVYLQLVDRSVFRSNEGFSPPGRRYVPASGATLQVTFDSVDSTKQVVKTATQPFANDPSIWKVDILATDNVVGTVTVLLQLTEGAKVTRGVVPAAALVQPSSGG